MMNKTEHVSGLGTLAELENVPERCLDGKGTASKFIFSHFGLSVALCARKSVAKRSAISINFPDEAIIEWRIVALFFPFFVIHAMVCVCVCVDVYMVFKRKRSLLSHYFMFSRLLWPTCFSTHSSQWFGDHTKLALYLRMHLNLNVAVVLLVFNAHFLVCSCVFVCVVLFRLCPFLFLVSLADFYRSVLVACDIIWIFISFALAGVRWSVSATVFSQHFMVMFCYLSSH